MAIRRSVNARHNTEVLKTVRRLRFLKTTTKTKRFSTTATGQEIPFIMHVIRVTVCAIVVGVYDGLVTSIGKLGQRRFLVLLRVAFVIPTDVEISPNLKIAQAEGFTPILRRSVNQSCVK